MKRTLGFVIMAGLLAPNLAAQHDVSARLAGRLGPDVAAAVSAVVDSATTRGLPADPLVNKALEGAVKGVPGERIVAAVRMVFEQMNTAAAALGGVGKASAGEITAGAFAISAGLGANDVTEIANTAGSTYPTATALQVAGTLTALGVPPAASVNLVDATIKAGGPVGDLITLPSQVQAAMAHGAQPAAAAASLARAAAAHAAPRPPHPQKGQPNQHKP
jgi:hypothetical protein